MINIDYFIHPDAAEKPLDTLIPTGGMTSIFRRIACVGDSLSSGELETWDPTGKKVYLDLFEHSWGQYIARMTGAKVYNFSKGGMTAKEYLESFANARNFWDPKLACDAYIIALGVNDLFGHKQTVGSTADINRDSPADSANTLAGYFGQLVLRLRTIQPDAKFFFLTMPRGDKDPEHVAIGDAHAKLMYDFAAFFPNSYVIDLRQYGPVYDDEFRKNYYGGGHLNTMGYYLTALEVASYIDYIIRHNPYDFRSNGLAGLPYTLL